MSEPSRKPAAELQPGRELAIWMMVMLVLGALPWVTGFQERALSQAVEAGSARAERRGIGEVRDDQIRKAVKAQQDTQPFWKTLWLLGDLLLEPLAMALRTLGIAITFSAVAALAGRSIGFEPAFDDCARSQSYWALGLAVRVSLMLILGRNEVDTSLALVWTGGKITALSWLMMRQVDVFAILGWMSMARGGWKRGQVSLALAITVCVLYALMEAGTRVALEAAIGAVIRQRIMPE